MSEQSVGTEQQERSERLARLRERTDRDYPETWMPTEADAVLAGEFARLEQGHTAYGPADIAIIRTEDGIERSVWLLHEVLRNQLVRLEPKPGELICIRWKGKRESGGGNKYDDYRVEVDREDVETDWNAIGTASPSADNGAQQPAAAPQDPRATTADEQIAGLPPAEEIPF